MKKITLLFLLMLVFFSCRKSYDYDEAASIVGTWKPIKAKASKYVGGIKVSSTENFNDCQLQARMVYNENLTARETRFDNNTGTCEQTLDRNFTYVFNANDKSLVHTFSDGSTKTAEVLSITSTDLVVKGEKIINNESYEVEVTNIRVN